MRASRPAFCTSRRPALFHLPSVFLSSSPRARDRPPRGVAAARGRLRRRRSSPMRPGIAFVASYCIRPRGARNAATPFFSSLLGTKDFFRMDRHDGTGRRRDNARSDAAEEEAGDAGAAVSAYDDEVAVEVFRGLGDGLIGRAGQEKRDGANADPLRVFDEVLQLLPGFLLEAVVPLLVGRWRNVAVEDQAGRLVGVGDRQRGAAFFGEEEGSLDCWRRGRGEIR